MESGEAAIHKIYEAANEPEYWNEAAEAIVGAAGGSAVHLLLASLETGYEYVNLFAGGDGGFSTEYLRDYAAGDFRVPRVMARKLGAFTDEREYVSKDEAGRSPIHQQLLPRYEVHNISGANMCLEDCIGWFGISTSKSSVEFDNRQRSYLTHLSRHLLNACRIAKTHQDLRLSRDQSLGSLDLLHASLILLKSDRVVHMNEAAKALSRAGFFMVRNERLCCVQQGAQAKLSTFLKQAARVPPNESLLLRQREQDAAYLISVHDLFPQYNGGRMHGSSFQALSIVELNIPPKIDFEEVFRFCSGYGVSRAEAMAVHASLNSIGLGEFAEKRGIGINTAQQQLKSALAKMGMNSQKKLFRAFELYRIFNGAERSTQA